LRSGQLRSRSLFMRAASTRTLSLAASPSRPVKGLVGRFELSRPVRLPASCPALHRTGETDASPRLLQPTHDTSTRRVIRLPISPACASRATLEAYAPCVKRETPTNHRVEPRLTAKPPASAPLRSRVEPAGVLTPFLALRARFNPGGA
jgi:hypothetical protein